jgi:DNA-binding PadR family transcriptional regulator
MADKSLIKGKRGIMLSAMHKKAADTLFSAFLLWFISKKPMHGYEMISTMRKEHELVHIGPSHVYPILGSLLKEGMIKVKSEAIGKRIKKLYSITQTGKARLKEIKKTYFGDNIRTRFMREMLS